MAKYSKWRANQSRRVVRARSTLDELKDLNLLTPPKLDDDSDCLQHLQTLFMRIEVLKKRVEEYKSELRTAVHAVPRGNLQTGFDEALCALMDARNAVPRENEAYESFVTGALCHVLPAPPLRAFVVEYIRFVEEGPVEDYFRLNKRVKLHK